MVSLTSKFGRVIFQSKDVKFCALEIAKISKLLGFLQNIFPSKICLVHFGVTHFEGAMMLTQDG